MAVSSTTVRTARTPARRAWCGNGQRPRSPSRIPKASQPEPPVSSARARGPPLRPPLAWPGAPAARRREGAAPVELNPALLLAEPVAFLAGLAVLRIPIPLIRARRLVLIA